MPANCSSGCQIEPHSGARGLRVRRRLADAQTRGCMVGAHGDCRGSSRHAGWGAMRGLIRAIALYFGALTTSVLSLVGLALMIDAMVK